MPILTRDEIAEWDAALQTLRPCAACGRLVEWSAEDDAAAVTCQPCCERAQAVAQGGAVMDRPQAIVAHTPGPWTVGQYTPTPVFRAISNHSCVCDPMTLALIALCGRAEDRQSQVDADLIAAAPELLAACKAVLSSPRYGDTPSPEAVELVRAAVAKAEGRS